MDTTTSPGTELRCPRCGRPGLSQKPAPDDWLTCTGCGHRAAAQYVADIAQLDPYLDHLHARRDWLYARIAAGDQPAAPEAGPAMSMQRVLLGTGAVLLTLAGLVFAAVAWAVVGATGKVAVLVAVGLVMAVLGARLRAVVPAAASTLTTVAAGLFATAACAAPQLAQVSWSPAMHSGYVAGAGVVLAAVSVAGRRLTRIGAWTWSAATATATAVVAGGLAVALHLDDPLGYTATAALAAIIAVGVCRGVRPRAALPAPVRLVLAVGASSSLASLNGWWAQQDRVAAYSLALLCWAAVLVIAAYVWWSAGRTRSSAAGLAAALVAGALALPIGARSGAGAPDLVLLSLAAATALLVAYVRMVPVLPGCAVVGTWAAAAVAIPVASGTAASTNAVITYLSVVGLTTAASGLAPRRSELTTAGRGVLMWLGGIAGSLAWLVHRVAQPVAPIEWVTAPIGAILLLAGAGWALVAWRDDRFWLASRLTLLPGMVLLVVPGAAVALDLSWTDPSSLSRTVVYTLVGAVLIAVGAQARVAAALIAGELAVGLCVLAHVFAAVREVPHWISLAVAGALVLAVGVRWEWLRTRGVSAAGWVGALR